MKSVSLFFSSLLLSGYNIFRIPLWLAVMPSSWATPSSLPTPFYRSAILLGEKLKSSTVDLSPHRRRRLCFADSERGS